MIADVGRLIGIARREARRAPMEPCAAGFITAAEGLAGDCKGAKYPRRQLTVLQQDAWETALAELGKDLPWTTRRANLLVEGIRLPRGLGSILRIGSVELEVTGQTYPCRRMEQACPGLLSALAKDWRGGITTRVLKGGPVAIGDTAEVVLARPEPKSPRLPG
jgi:MOSC domain-containing protein YiiM